MKEIITATIALGLTGLGFALLLAFLSRKLKVQEDPRVAKIIAILPGANCGACGFAGCKGFAEAVISEGKIFSGCIPGGRELNEKIAEIIGVANKTSEIQKTIIACRCGAQTGEKKESFLYAGPKTCKAAHAVGSLDCVYGCLGFGDCVNICPTGALSLKNKKIYIDTKKCIACGKCIATCPRSLFELIAVTDSGAYEVCCNNTEKALNVKKVCSRGCIACGICTKIDNSPYYLKDNLSYIDFTKTHEQNSLQNGKEKCPTKCISKLA